MEKESKGVGTTDETSCVRSVSRMAARKCAAMALRTSLVQSEACAGQRASRWAQVGTRGAHGEPSVAACSGVPEEVLERKVTIFKPSRVATQQGLGNTMEWKIDFGVKDKWENPLMGWVSTGDPVACVGNATLTFDTKDAAIAFCKKYGWAYEVVEPNENSKTRPQRFQGYADNFSVKRGGLPILPGAKAEPEDDW